MAGRLDEAFGGKRICYSCGNSYPGIVRFCPMDSTDLEYLPQPLDSISRGFKRPTRWAAISIVAALLLLAAGFTMDFLSSSTSANASERGQLTVRTTPAGARVFLDGSQVGISPVRLSDIPTGVHEVKAVFPGYSASQAQVQILPSANQKLVWDLSPLPSRNKVKDKNKFVAQLPSIVSPSALSENSI